MKSESSMSTTSAVSAQVRLGMFIKGVLLVMSVAGLGQTTEAIAGIGTDAELKMLPPYCEARLNRTPEYEYWRKTLGPDYEHTHHFCEAMIYLNRYPTARSKKSKEGILNSALGNLNYMVSHAKSSYTLMPEVYVGRGQVFAYQHKISEALNDFHKAIELNPKMARAYVLAVDTLIKSSKPEDALQLATAGLRHTPENRALQRFYDQLGGVKPYPEPFPDIALKKEPIAKNETVAKEETPAPMNPSTPANGASPTNTPGTDQKLESTSPAPPNIGTPTNPWCRFCPDIKK